MRRTLFTAFVLVTFAGSASAQRIIPDLPTLGSSWTDIGYPKVYWTPTNGVSFGLYYAQVRPPGYDDWDAPPPYRANIAIDAEISTSGTYHVGLDFKFPNFFPGWRFDLRFWTLRAARQNYFGIGNNTTYDGDNVTDDQPYYYKMDRRRLFIRGTAQRHIIGGLRALAGFHIERWKLDTLSGTTLLGNQVQAGLAPLVGTPAWQGALRLGLVFDSRDDEVTPHRGVLIEALFDVADSSVVGDLSFNRFTVSAAAYDSFKEKLVIGGRIVGQNINGSPPAGTYFTVEATERAFGGLGGSLSHRAVYADRFLAQDKLFGNLDIRYMISGSPQIGTVSLLGFVDVGRVFQPTEDDFTLKDLHVGGGLGPILTIGRNGIIGMTFAWGPDKLIVQTHTSWMF